MEQKLNPIPLQIGRGSILWQFRRHRDVRSYQRDSGFRAKIYWNKLRSKLAKRGIEDITAA
jgi:hypothetical protein